MENNNQNILQKDKNNKINNDFKNRKNDKTKKNKKVDECVELKNINYKNMLLKGSNLSNNEEKYDNKLLDKMLEEETKLNMKEHWIKLDKCNKIIKLKEYGNELIDKYSLNIDEVKNMHKFFNMCIELKKISKLKDIDYNKDTGKIINIPILLFNNESRNFYIKKNEKHISTLKSIGPKKNKTVKT